MQAHGALGLSQDTPLAAAFVYGRYTRVADGPDEVHMAQLAKWTVAGVATRDSKGLGE